MKVIFYINPFIVRSDMTFYKGAVKNILLPEIKSLLPRGVKVYVVSSEVYKSVFSEIIDNIKFIDIGINEISEKIGSVKNIEEGVYRGDKEVISRVTDFYREVFERVDNDIFDADFVITWETPISFFKSITPRAVLVHQMPGFLSRSPFPGLITFDTSGLFRESALWKALEEGVELDPEEEETALKMISVLKERTLPFMVRNSPFRRADLDPNARYDKLILLPLQISDQYAFRADFGYGSQLEYLVDVLSATPENVGVVATQYISNFAAERAINDRTYEHLKEKFPNLIYLKDFEKYDNISQYLLPFVDAVVSASSSLAFQALLWNKPVIAWGDYLEKIADYDNIQQFAHNNIIADEAEANNKNVNILKYILLHHQVLHETLIGTNYFPNLLETIKSDRFRGFASIPFKKDRGSSKLPYDLFSYDIDRSSPYKKEFENISEKRVSRALHLLGKDASPKEIFNFCNMVEDKKPTVISFDIFDTLVERVIEQPMHVFTFMEGKISQVTGIDIPNFASLRMSVEKNLKKYYLENNISQEVSIYDIYEKICHMYGLEKGLIQKLVQLEEETDLNFLAVREIGKDLFEIAQKKCENVICISDTYYSREQILRILGKCGYPTDCKVYLSSEIGLTKNTGDIFPVILEEENIPGKKLLHVGDNPIGDISRAQAHGMTTFFLKKPFYIMRDNNKYKQLVTTLQQDRSLALSAIYGLIQRRIFPVPSRAPSKITLFNGDPFIFGYVALGQLFFGYLKWIIDEAKKDYVRTIYFMSRDGKILYNMAKVLFDEVGVEYKYLLSSRRSTRVAAIFGFADIVSICTSSIQKTTLREFINAKFGVDITTLPQQPDIDLYPGSQIDSSMQEKLIEYCYAIKDFIFENSRKERSLLRSYYKDMGLEKEDKIAIVDIGYAGNIQESICRIVGRNDILGYYFITTHHALNRSGKYGNIKAYAGNYISRQHDRNVISSNGFLYEVVFCSSDKSFIKFHRNGDKIYPVFNDIEEDAIRIQLIERAHEGALSFSHDLERYFDAYLGDLYLDAASASRFLDDMIMRPSGRDAGLFEGVKFDDPFVYKKLRYIVPPRDKLKSIPASDCIWKKGAEVFSRRKDIANKSVNDIRGIKNFFALIHLEDLVVRTIASSRKYKKYEQNRSDFFMDSKNIFVRYYWKVVAGRKSARY